MQKRCVICIKLFIFRNTTGNNRRVISAIQMKTFFKLCKRDLNFRIILKLIKIKLYVCNPPYFWSLLLKMTYF